MKRRSFFATLLAPVVAKLAAKPKPHIPSASMYGWISEEELRALFPYSDEPMAFPLRGCSCQSREGEHTFYRFSYHEGPCKIDWHGTGEIAKI